MKFGERLKVLRTTKCITQIDLAKVLNVGRSTIAGYETKGKQPDYDKLIKISKYFNVSIDYLLGNSNNKNIEFEKTSTINCELNFNNPESAFTFILKQKSIMDYGDYDPSEMSEEEIIEIVNDLLVTLKVSLERQRKNSKEK